MIQRIYSQLTVLLFFLSVASLSTQAQVTVLTSTTHLPRNVAEPIYFTAYGCDGQVVWLNFLQQPIGTGNVSQDTPSFQGTNTYFVKCGDAAPIRFLIDKTRTTRSTTPIISADRTTINAGETVTLTAPNCSGVVTWMSNNFVLSKSSTFVATPTTNTTYSALCTESTNSVSLPSAQLVTVQVNNPSLPPPIINTRDLTGVVQIGQPTQLGAFNCFYTVNWLKNGDGIGSGTTITVTAAAGDIYTATCSNDGVVSPASNAISTPRPAPVIQNELMNRTVCLNASTTFQIEATGATSFQWQFNNQNIIGATNASYTISQVTEAQVGSYRVIVSNASGSVTSNSAAVSLFAPISVSMSSTSVACFGGINGTATVAASNGLAPYSFVWSNGASGSTISNLAAGNYTVTVTDANGCTATNNVTVTQPAELVASASSQSVSCFEGTNGTATVAVSGGTSPYRFSWSNGAEGSTITNLTAGTYSVTVTDANGCTTSTNVSVTQPSQLIASLATQSVSCFEGTNGAITFTGSGGTSPYRFLWSNGATGPAITNLVAGAYSVTVTDANGCTAEGNAMVTQPERPVAISLTSTAVSCFEGSNGTATVTGSGGTVPYRFLWSNSGTASTITNVTAGTYSVTITDANGCILTGSVPVTQPEAPLGVQVSATPVSCFGGSNGSATAIASRGTAPYSYLWSNGLTDPTITNVPAGDFTVTVTDANGCIASTAVPVPQPSQLVASVTNQPVLCHGENTGSALVAVSGGIFPYTFTWSNGLTVNNPSNLPAGVFSVVVTDANRCTSELSTTITQPEPLAYSFLKEDVKCFGGTDGKIELIPTGGTAPYQMIANGQSLALTGQLFRADSYQINVRDANNCLSGFTTVQIQQPSSPVTAQLLEAKSPRGFGLRDGLVVVEIKGGTGPFSGFSTTWSWDGGSNSSEIKTETGNSLKTTLENAGGGNYTLQVTDTQFAAALSKAGCTATLTYFLEQPEKITAVTSVDKGVSCFGKFDGQLSAVVRGGVIFDNTNPYQYQWFKKENETRVRLNETADKLINVDAGLYVLRVTDKNDITAEFEVNLNVTPSLLTTVVAQENPTCSSSKDGFIEIQTVGGVAPLTVDWGGGISGSKIVNLSAGNYFGVVRDREGCTGEVAVALSAKENVQVRVAKKTESICFNGCDGAIELQVQGNISPFTVAWTQNSTMGTAANLSGTVVNNLCPGEYIANITTNLGCTVSSGAILLANPAVKTIQVSDDLIVCSDANVEIDAAALVPSKSYLWTLPSGLQTTAPRLLIRENGTYALQVEDANGCKASDSFSVQVVNVSNGLLFSVASSGVMGEFVYAVNLTPTSVPTAWRVTGPASVVREENSLLVLNPTGIGQIQIELLSSAGGCVSNIKRIIEITDGLTTNTKETIQWSETPANHEQVNELLTENSFIVYPNPTAGLFYVKTGQSAVKKASVRIVEATMNRLVHQEDFIEIDTFGVPVHLDAYALKEGSYYVIIVVDDQRIVKRLFVKDGGGKL